MFKRIKSDRRQGYSFIGHAQRVIATKGFSRVGMSLGGTALIAALVFAHCSSSSITGPKSPTSALKSAPASGVSKNDVGSTDTWLPAAQFGPITVPGTILPNPFADPCTHQNVVWDPANSFTTMSGYTQSSTSGALRSQTNEYSKAYGTSLDPLDPQWRKYKGAESYSSQLRVYVTGAERYREEWDMKVIAYDKWDRAYDPDDFFFHVVVKTSIDPTKSSMRMYAYCTDADYGWWKNDYWYEHDDD